ncbi:kinase-like protein [Phellopilus nigrolimitatus]|nr:kinase-like protein [Phellopilus nigrolimitatus]
MLFIGAVDDQWQMFSDDPDDYSVGVPIGFGASSIVHVAQYVPKDGSPSLPCAVKIVDLEKLPPQSLRLLRRETQLMRLSKHPNLLRVRGTWMTGYKLFIALRLMNSGSAADVMHYGWPGGMEEEVVKCILKQALEGLNYLHINGFIHRDIKAANLLIDDDGTVLLGDLGVAASLCDEEPMPAHSGSGPKVNFDKKSDIDHPRLTTAGPSAKKLGKRKSFVGTPCWMAPELISGKQYDAKADIWSFGITAIELTQGRAPRSREAPARVLLRTVQEEPPAFMRESGQHKFSKAFKDIVESCLAKDPSRRPSAAELLESPFFKGAKRKNYIVGAILKDLPPLTSRQERRASNRLTAPSRSSMSSWDFSLELPHTPSTQHGHHRSPRNSSAHSTYFGSSHSHHPSVLQNPSRLDALEENAYAGILEQLRLARPNISHRSGSPSPDSSVFDLSDDESSPTTPEVATPSLPASSTTTTPLSCSPATVLNIPADAGKPTVARGIRDGSTGEGTLNSKPNSKPDRRLESQRPGSSSSQFGLPSLPSPTEKPAQTRSVHTRRGSLPESAQARPSLTALPALKRMTSFSAVPSSSSAPNSDAKSDSNVLVSLTATVPPSPNELAHLQQPTPIGTAPPKASRWLKLIRGGSGSPKGTDDGVGMRDNVERKKGTLGRILERTGK